MIKLTKALSILDQITANSKNTYQCAKQHETIATHASLERVLAETQLSRLNLPPFNKSAMDGYAVARAPSTTDASSNIYHLIGTIAAGDPPSPHTLHPDDQTAIKIMTGAPVPAGAIMVVPLEMATEQDGKVTINSVPRTTNICQRGEDVHCNDPILPHGTLIDPIALANLISCGITTIPVYRQPRVAIIATGSEIVNDVAMIAGNTSRIMDSNSPMLGALCSKHGLKVTACLNVADDFDLTVTTLQQAFEQADIVLLSGGVSAGAFDFVAKALAAIGFNIHFDRVAIKPGKPITFASNADNKLAFGLPGNPVSVYLTFHLFVLRTLRNLLSVSSETKEMDGEINEGISNKKTATQNQVPSFVLQQSFYQLPLAKTFERATKSPRLEFIPCRILRDGSILMVESHGSAHLAALLACDGFCIIPEDAVVIAAGDRVTFVVTR